MKRKLMIIVFTMSFILANIITCYAATEPTVTLQADKTEVKAGETFTVTLSATCEDGINGIDTTYTYDTERLELVSANVASSNFSSLGTENQITVICNSTESITSSDIYVLTFKVKDGIEVGSTAIVSVSETMIDSDAATNSQHTVAAQEVTITIKSDAADPDTPTDPRTPTDPDIPVVPDEPSENGDSTQTPGQSQTTTDETTVVAGGDKDTTIADTVIPKAGINVMIIIAIMATLIGALVIYRKNQGYIDIK